MSRKEKRLSFEVCGSRGYCIYADTLTWNCIRQCNSAYLPENEEEHNKSTLIVSCWNERLKTQKIVFISEELFVKCKKKKNGLFFKKTKQKHFNNLFWGTCRQFCMICVNALVSCQVLNTVNSTVCMFSAFHIVYYFCNCCRNVYYSLRQRINCGLFFLFVNWRNVLLPAKREREKQREEHYLDVWFELCGHTLSRTNLNSLDARNWETPLHECHVVSWTFL